MPGRCSAFNCRNTFKNVKHKTNKVTFHSFPKRDPKRIKEWVGQMKWKDWQPTPHSLLCSEHFEERCMDRTGQTVRLRDDAIPTIFAFPSHLQKKFQKTAGRRKRVTLFPEDPVPEESTQREKSPPTYLNHSIWHPSRFHDDYCVPQSIDWAVKDMPKEIPSATLEKQGLIFIPKHAIKIKEKWDWLTMDVKGPFPETKSRHKFVLTVMDYYSKWMEAYPMKTNNSKEIAKIISDLISRFGFPVGILSCLTRAHILEINLALGDLKKLTCQLIFYRPLGVSLDPVTKSLVDRLVSDLVKEHPDRWDVYLAASVFSFCCKEHPTTRQIPLSLLRCGGTQSVSTSPRKLPDNGIKGRTFVILDAQPPQREVRVECNQCSQWSTVSQDSELKRYEEMKLGEEDYTHTCVSCRVAMSCRVALEVMRG
ncbi:uncharacterized protein LOC118964964 isoform X2 [Oncorhynchus mykiss]|uniref:THAP-type domain-containing protein n=1 Tax=Oncorhynchus mykiss TaxID=8022 RepID=A0A8K9V6D7_ONCMY|nr:uncharacterized protein LOC118964964 isoform X2 [Oncorhynchus mykiss]